MIKHAPRRVRRLVENHVSIASGSSDFSQRRLSSQRAPTAPKTRSGTKGSCFKIIGKKKVGEHADGNGRGIFCIDTQVTGRIRIETRRPGRVGKIQTDQLVRYEFLGSDVNVVSNRMGEARKLSPTS